MTAPVFVDTNVLVYARDASEPDKQSRAADWIGQLWERRRGRLSTQVLQEFYVTVTRKLDPGMAPQEARRDVRDLLAWRPVPMEPVLIQRAWDVQDRFDFSFWDALIVAAAQFSGCRYLLTEDLSADQEVDDLRVVDPFAATFDQLC